MNIVVVIEFNETIEWIKFNTDEVGYYRVNYEATEWETLNHLLRYYHKVNDTSE